MWFRLMNLDNIINMSLCRWRISVEIDEIVVKFVAFHMYFEGISRGWFRPRLDQDISQNAYKILILWHPVQYCLSSIVNSCYFWSRLPWVLGQITNFILFCVYLFGRWIFYKLDLLFTPSEDCLEHKKTS